MGFRLQQDLREVLPGFSHFVFKEYGPEAKLLRVVFDSQKGPPVTLDFSSLSDGQRMLVALYAVLHGLDAKPEGSDGSVDQPTRTLCLDEYRLSPEVPSSLRAACREIRRNFPEKRCVEAID
jgi:hypothetical protein